MRKNNNITLAQVMKSNASSRRSVNSFISKSILGSNVFLAMKNSGDYQSENNYEPNCLKIRLYNDGIYIESLYNGDDLYYNKDGMFLFIEEIPNEYRKIKALYKQKGLKYKEVMWLNF